MPIVYNSTQYSGIWPIQQVNAAIAAGTWPTAPPPSNGLYSWGYGINGLSGLGNTTDYSSPKQVGSLVTWYVVATGSQGPSFAIKTDSTLWGWGRNVEGQLGLGNTTNYSSPVQIGALSIWSGVASHGTSTIATQSNGTIWSWGANTVGQLGLGNLTAYSSPKQIGALTNWLTISGNYQSTFALAVKTDGTLWSWGRNGSGQLGLGNTTYYSSPKQVGSLTNWKSVWTGSTINAASFAIKTDGTLWSWGRNNNGQLGLGNTTYYSSPKQVGSLTNWLTICAAYFYAVAVKTDGTLWTWGTNNNGALGLGNTTSYSSPKQIGALTTWLKAAGGTYATGAIRTDGTLWTWGQNNRGMLGLGNITNYSSPKQVGSSTSWLQVAVGQQNMLAIG
jgi:alpha-tubulin suppressor-like RCC1 family protein